MISGSNIPEGGEIATELSEPTLQDSTVDYQRHIRHLQVVGIIVSMWAKEMSVNLKSHYSEEKF